MTDEVAEAGEGESLPLFRRIKLWDWPVRIVHWGFVVLLPALWWTAENDRMAVHRWLGYVALGLIVFRLYWGFAGSAPARFSTFLKGPRAIAAYVRGAGHTGLGHNPLGALSVVALLGLLFAQVILGLFTQDIDGLEAGPLARYVSYSAADTARVLHGAVFIALLWAVGLHVSAVTLYGLVGRTNLLGPMLTGWKRVPAHMPSPRLAPLWRWAAGLIVASGVVFWVLAGAPLPELAG
ncbi:Ni/Fe-hydrogenase 1 b-type cytochrome subunit [Rhizobium sp. CRIBSB]|nr:Ni/Fe-hydrogenase 1 b-type cytochrome subunit [Rhizobium sp. CRIBSB]